MHNNNMAIDRQAYSDFDKKTGRGSDVVFSIPRVSEAH